MSKLVTIFFMALSAIFAGLYFSGGPSDEKIVYVEVPVKSGHVEVEQQAPKVEQSAQAISANTPETRLIIKEINTFKDVSQDEVEMLVSLLRYHRRDEGKDYKEDHPLLFKRLELDPETEEAFLSLMADRQLTREFRSRKWMTDEEKEEAEAKRKEFQANIDQKTEELLGSEYDTYIGYREKSHQYRIVAEMDKKLAKENSNLSDDQQDQLAEMLYNNKKESTDFDWQTMKESPETMDQWLSLYKEKQSIMAEKAGSFLEGEQLKVFEKSLKSHYNRYAGYVDYQKKKLKSKANNK